MYLALTSCLLIQEGIMPRRRIRISGQTSPAQAVGGWVLRLVKRRGHLLMSVSAATTSRTSTTRLNVRSGSF